MTEMGKQSFSVAASTFGTAPQRPEFKASALTPGPEYAATSPVAVSGPGHFGKAPRWTTNEEDDEPPAFYGDILKPVKPHGSKAIFSHGERFPPPRSEGPGTYYQAVEAFKKQSVVKNPPNVVFGNAPRSVAILTPLEPPAGSQSPCCQKQHDVSPRAVRSPRDGPGVSFGPPPRQALDVYQLGLPKGSDAQKAKQKTQRLMASSAPSAFPPSFKAVGSRGKPAPLTASDLAYIFAGAPTTQSTRSGPAFSLSRRSSHTTRLGSSLPGPGAYDVTVPPGEPRVVGGAFPKAPKVVKENDEEVPGPGSYDFTNFHWKKRPIHS